ncbi:hypothetical protein [Actinoallomurus sp. NPDC050550]|uniref:hypothetical protein n=1 Tax=Actinoallomurus sp. NPDC050550 TaxID=3154937 RepID=UPI0034034230
MPDVSGGIFEFALQVDRPTAVEHRVDAAGLPANAYDLVLAARDGADRAKALLDGGTAGS